MEKIFIDSRIEIEDNGFSQQVMNRIIDSMPRPSRYMYRAPTLITAFATAVVIAVVVIFVDLDGVNEKYDQIADAISYNHLVSDLDFVDYE